MSSQLVIPNGVTAAVKATRADKTDVAHRVSDFRDQVAELIKVGLALDAVSDKSEIKGSLSDERMGECCMRQEDEGCMSHTHTHK